MQSENDFDLIFASNPNDEDLVAEIYTDQFCVAEIRKLNSQDHQIRFINEHGKNLGEMKVDSLLELISRARCRLD